MRLIALLSLCLAIGSCSRSGEQRNADKVTVFAAASLADVITELARTFEDEHGIVVRCSFDASSTLARQIMAGAPADVFLSANAQWMDELANAGAIQRESRRDVVSNRLVLVAPVETDRLDQIDWDGPWPKVGRLALADPTHVPAGQYARESLESLGWWNDAEKAIIPALDVRSALRLVETGEANAGFVYATDAAVSVRVRIVGMVPADAHSPILYPAALCNDTSDAGARFVEFLVSNEARQVFAQHGFEQPAVASGSS